MRNSTAINFAAVFALSVWATASLSQQSGHMHTAPAAVSTTASPYAGEQARDIKSLSASDIDSLQSGAGMAYAKAAELNGYPGPSHVLELASQLQLNGNQRSATEKLMARHKSTARSLGAQLVEAERAMDFAFASKQVDAQRIAGFTQRIGALQSTLRAEHLQTHLEQTALLSPQQIASYQSLRGYGKPAGQGQTHAH